MDNGQSKRSVFCERIAHLCVWAGGVVWLCGCHAQPTKSPLSGSYYLNPNRDLERIGRVALVELDNHSHYPEISKDATQALFVAIQKKQLFGISMVGQSDEQWRGLEMKPDKTYSTHELVKMRNALGCDAVLSGAVTEYQPYPHQMMGIRLRLTDVKDGTLIWAVEHLWDSTDTESKYRASYFYKTRLGEHTVERELLQMSTGEFLRFIAFEIADTLSERFRNP